MSLNLINFFDWFSSNLLTKPWLVIGKGPSFDNIGKVDLDKYHIVGLNHVMYKVDCLLGHAIDLEVLSSSEKPKCKFLVMPMEPHVRFKPCGDSLDNLFKVKSATVDVPVLWYNSSRSLPLMIRSGPMVRVKLFSAVAVVNLLANAGVKEIFTLGVDEGTKYSKEFDVSDKLSNGRLSFDGQKKEFRIAQKVFGTLVVPLF